MFASRSLKEKSCSMEVFFSFIVVVCSSGMMFPGSFRLFVTWKYKSRKFYRNKVGRFSFHWSEVFSYEKKNQKKYWKKRHTENDNKYRVILFVCKSQGFNVSNNDVNKKQYIPRFRYFTHRNTIRCPHWKKKTFHWFSCIIFELWRKRSKRVLVSTKTKKLASSANTFIFWSGNIDYFNTYAFVVLNEWKEWSVCLSVIWDWKLSILFSNKGF